MGQRLGADIACQAIADAISRRKDRLRFWARSVLIVSETQVGSAVGLDLDDELCRRWSAVQQVPLRQPDAYIGIVDTGQYNGGKCLLSGLVQSRTRCDTRVVRRRVGKWASRQVWAEACWDRHALARLTVVTIRPQGAEKGGFRNATEQLIGKRQAMVHQHHIAPGDAYVSDELLPVLHIGARRNTHGKG